MNKGVFLSLDGVDGAGKSTQSRMLADWLRASGRGVITCRDPGGTLIGDDIRQLLLDYDIERAPWCDALLFMASRAQLVAEVIRPALARGDIVVCDRFLLANVVYQGHAGGLPVDRLWEIGELATGGLLPDLMLVLDVPPETAAGRKDGQADYMERRGLVFQAKVRAGFLAEAAKNPDRIRIVDASRPVAEVQETIRREVAHVLGEGPRP